MSICLGIREILVIGTPWAGQSQSSQLPHPSHPLPHHLHVSLQNHENGAARPSKAPNRPKHKILLRPSDHHLLHPRPNLPLSALPENRHLHPPLSPHPVPGCRHSQIAFPHPPRRAKLPPLRHWPPHRRSFAPAAKANWLFASTTGTCGKKSTAIQ